MPAVTVLGIVIAVIGGLATIARLEHMAVYAPWQLMLIVSSICFIAYAAGAPYREFRRLKPRTDWPCEISMQRDGVHIVGTDLYERPIDCLIAWTALQYVTIWCEFGEPPIVRISRRVFFEPEPEVPSFHLAPSEPPLPKTYFVNCRYDEAAAMVRAMNCFIRASRRAGRSSSGVVA